MSDQENVKINFNHGAQENVPLGALLVGLGGSGGEVLFRLYNKLSEDQKLKTRSLFLDTDQRDIDKLLEQNVNAVSLGDSGKVRNVAAFLGKDDGVQDWLPCDPKKDAMLLASATHNGASQCRYKSRLCLARFLKDPNNELHNMLVEMNEAGWELMEKPAKIIIASSVAGGTGAGSFIQVALYIRNFFRARKRNVTIIGLLACPDLFFNRVKESEREVLYANAYAAIRELNAMNLSVCGLVGENGERVKIRIDTKSEGKLFDPEDKAFINQPDARPFDNIYFIDRINEDGAELGSLEHYYGAMADIAHALLFTSIEGRIDTGVSNEGRAQEDHPNAIYGSAGYSRVIYPYKDVLTYLAKRNLEKELDERWTYFDSEWEAYMEQQADAARLRGRTWRPSEGEREGKFIQCMDQLLREKNPEFSLFAPMVGFSDGGRADAYEQSLTDAMSETGVLSLQAVDAVKTAWEEAQDSAVLISNGDGGGPSARSQLVSVARVASQCMQNLSDEIIAAMDQQVSAAANKIFPVTEAAIVTEKKNRDELNLFSGLLCVDGKAVHPVAARYLLYRLRRTVRQVVAAGKQREALDDINADDIRDMNLVFDKKKDDDDDITVEVYAERNLKTQKKLYNYAFWLEQRARGDLKTLQKKIAETLSELMNNAEAELRIRVYEILLERLNGLIAQYESLFESLDSYHSALHTEVKRESRKHVSGDARMLYVGATPKVKEELFADVSDVLRAAEEDICNEVGAAVYDTLLFRYIDKVAQERNAARRKALLGEESISYREKPIELGRVFRRVEQAYVKYLRDNAPELDMNVVEAMVKQCCQKYGIDESDIHGSERERFLRAFEELMKDARYRAAPLLQFNLRSLEDDTGCEDCSKPYRIMGVNSKTKAALDDIYGTTGSDEDIAKADEKLRSKVGLTDTPVAIDEVFENEILFLSTIHLLQPIQINKFNENYEQSYHKKYRACLESALKGENPRLSQTGHLDKRWHLRGMMPYISASLEESWRKDLMKALVYLMLNDNISFGEDNNGVKCFRFNDRIIRDSEGKQVSINELLSVIRYLAEMELQVPVYAQKMDEWITENTNRIANENDSLANYKRAMTIDPMLMELRKTLLEYVGNQSSRNAGHGENFADAKSYDMNAEDCESIRLARQMFSSDAAEPENEIKDCYTKGGLLQIAWLIHDNEVKRHEKTGFAEALLACGEYILDRYCEKMCGKLDDLEVGTVRHQEYVELYNHAAQKMVQEFLTAVAVRKLKLKQEGLQKMMGKKTSRLASVYPDLRIPVQIGGLDEVKWIADHWKLKSYN